MTTTTRTNLNSQPRKTLASQLDRLDGILDGLDAALAGAVQEAVGMAVKEAVQVVLTEVLTNRPLQEQLQQTDPNTPLSEEPQGLRSTPHRLCRTMAAGVHRTVQTVKKVGRGVSLAMLAAGGMVAGVVYAARRRIVSAATTVFRHGKTLLRGAIMVLSGLLPSLAFGG